MVHKISLGKTKIRILYFFSLVIFLCIGMLSLPFSQYRGMQRSFRNHSGFERIPQLVSGMTHIFAYINLNTPNVLAKTKTPFTTHKKTFFFSWGGWGWVGGRDLPPLAHSVLVGLFWGAADKYFENFDIRQKVFIGSPTKLVGLFFSSLVKKREKLKQNPV